MIHSGVAQGHPLRRKMPGGGGRGTGLKNHSQG